MNYFLVDIFTQDSVVAQGIPAESVIIPTSKGQIQVKRDHTHVVEKLEVGELTIFGGADDPDRNFAVSDGICKVLKDKITILTSESFEDHELNLELAQRALDHAEEKLHEGVSEGEFEIFQNKRQLAQVKVQLAQRYSGKTK